MKKLVLAVALMSLSTSVVFAAEHKGEKATVQTISQQEKGEVYTDGSANGFGDHSPSSYEN